MGRWAEKYTEPQRQAVGRAMLEPDPLLGRTLYAKEAVQWLSEGRFEGVAPPPEPMPYTTAYWCRDRERQRQQGHQLTPLAKQAFQDPNATREKLAQRLVSVYEYQLDRVETQIRKGKQPDPVLCRLLGQMFRDVSGALGKPDPKRGAGHRMPKDGEKPQGQEQHDNTVKTILEQHQRTSRGIPA